MTLINIIYIVFVSLNRSAEYVGVRAYVCVNANNGHRTCIERLCIAITSDPCNRVININNMLKQKVE